MEQFTPGDEESWVKIKRWIDESDAYILILGGRYGSIEPESGKSYVELEYKYALSQNKPFMSILVTDEAHKRRVNEKGLDVVDERKYQDKLKVFRELVEKKHRATWSDVKDIKAHIFQKLPDWQARPELEGWIRAEEAVNAETLNELARLSKENSELREQVAASRVEFNGVSFDNLVKILREDKRKDLLKVQEAKAGTWNKICKEFSYLEPKNVGHLFELTMKLLARRKINFFETHLSSEDKSEDVWLRYNVDPLIEYGLAFKQSQSENGNTTSPIYGLTDAGMRLKNSLLAFADSEVRLKELWNVEADDSVSD